jgi:tetratricopeptide (TPR) repeat protein
VWLFRKPWHRATLILIFASAAIAWLRWESTRDPKISFLPGDRRGDWIIFPAALDAKTHRIASLDTFFRHEFALNSQPRAARLYVRGAKRVELKINGHSVDVGATRNWKDVSAVDVLGLLRTGVNLIEARVFNDSAPPSLWFSLRTDQLILKSDETWEASFTGSAWRRVALASTARVPGAGNGMAGGETTLRAAAAIWPIWLGFAAITLAICTVGSLWAGRLETTSSVRWRKLFQHRETAVLLIIASLWLVLFWNNGALLPYHTGFDSRFHINYIKYVCERRALPLPTEGFEMFQPPLYYVLAAGALLLSGLSVADSSAVLVLRSLGALFGIVHFTLVSRTVRLFFPQRISLQFVGLILAAFLPMQLYLSHFVTNETLAAALVTASVYLSLRLLRTEDPPISKYVWLGLTIGAAMLAKTTSLLLVPPLLLALFANLAIRRPPITIWVRNAGVMLAACFAVCGWHYVRIWRGVGTPFRGNWEVAAGFSWWQDAGYHTANDYIRFGRSLVSPLFSSFSGFADGIYSTLFGDALCGGASALDYRPPWNYSLIVAGYLLALVPTILMLTGAAVAACRFVRKPSSECFLLLGLGATVALAMIFMTLKVPFYTQAKAFYGLSALVPLCFFGAVGWDVLIRGRKLLQLVLGTILAMWAMSSFASVWIRQSVFQREYAGLRLASERQIDAAISEAAKAVNSDPSDASARKVLASILNDSGRPNEALPEAERAVELNSMNSDCHLQLGMVLAKQGHIEAAVNEARRALELGPENSGAYNLLLGCLVSSSRNDEIIDVARDALVVSPFNAQLHYTLALAKAKNGDFAGATNQFGYALLLQPEWEAPHTALRFALSSLSGDPDGSTHLKEAVASIPDSPVALNDFAWLLATHPDAALRNGPEAVRLAEHGCAITERKDVTLLMTLSAAYAEIGRFPDAVRVAEQARSLALSSGGAEAPALSQNLLDAFRVSRPYREDPIYKYK